jgi:SAM-dependent methyltransferase
MPSKQMAASRVPDGSAGWDEYAPFYDWENAQTVGRRDVAFWRRFAARAGGPVLELGCGTGRVTVPLARAGVPVVGIDRSAAMLVRAQRRLARPLRGSRGRQALVSSVASRRPDPHSPTAARSRVPARSRLVRGDIRALPFPRAAFAAVMAPYGILQSLTRDRDLAAALRSVAGVLRPGGLFGIDLVPDVPKWREYSDRVQLRGRAAGGAHLTLVESVRQDRRRHLTTFEQRYLVRRRGTTAEHRFVLTFRTLSVPQMVRRLAAAGLGVDAVLGDYRGAPWDDRADVWLIVAKKM